MWHLAMLQVERLVQAIVATGAAGVLDEDVLAGHADVRTAVGHIGGHIGGAAPAPRARQGGWC